MRNLIARKLGRTLIASIILGSVIMPIQALEVEVKVKKIDLVNMLNTALSSMKIRLNNHGSARYLDKNRGLTWRVINDSSIKVGSSVKKFDIPTPVITISRVKLRGGTKKLRIFKAYISDINSKNYVITSSNAKKMLFTVYFESNGPEVRIHCLRKTNSRHKRFHKACKIKGLTSPKLDVNKLKLSAKLSRSVLNNSITFDVVSKNDIDFDFKLKWGKLCSKHGKVCTKINNWAKSKVRKQLKQKFFDKINSRRKEVASKIRAALLAKGLIKYNWKLVRIRNLGSKYSITVKIPIDGKSVAAAF